MVLKYQSNLTYYFSWFPETFDLAVDTSLFHKVNYTIFGIILKSSYRIMSTTTQNFNRDTSH